MNLTVDNNDINPHQFFLDVATKLVETKWDSEKRDTATKAAAHCKKLANICRDRDYQITL